MWCGTFPHLWDCGIICNFAPVMTQRTKNIRNMNKHAESRMCRIVFVHWFSGFI